MKMRRFIYIIVGVMAVITSCTVETSDNGDLDGFWHLERIDTIATGGSCDVSNNKIFWGVQYKLIEITGGSGNIYFRFNQTSDSLVIHTPYISRVHEGDVQPTDSVLSDPSVLYPLGVEGLEVHYYKESFNSTRMILSSPTLKLHFKKF